MKKLQIAVLLLLLNLVSLAATLNEGFLNVGGAVVIDDRPMPGAEIKVLRGGEIVETYLTNRRGIFSIDLPLNQSYVLSFSSAGMITKKILFNTHIDRPLRNAEHFYFEFILDLFEEIPWINRSIFERPIISIAYDKNSGEFVYNPDEHRIIRSQLESIQKIRERVARMNRQQREILKLSEAFYLEGDFESAHKQLSQLLATNARDTFLINRLKVVENAIETKKREEEMALAQARKAESEVIKPTEPTFKTPEPQPPTTATPATQPIQPVIAATQPPQAVVADRRNIISEQIVPTPVTVETLPVRPANAMADHVTPRPGRVQETQNIPGEGIIFMSALTPGQALRINQPVIFIVQILALSGKPDLKFFRRITENMPTHQIVQYKDVDGLNKFGVGLHTNLDQAMETLRVLRNLGYDTFIVAFANGRRVRVNDAISILRQN